MVGGRQRVHADMLGIARKIDQRFALQYIRGDSIANLFLRGGRELPDSIPDLRKPPACPFGEGLDVCVDGVYERCCFSVYDLKLSRIACQPSRCMAMGFCVSASKVTATWVVPFASAKVVSARRPSSMV